MSADYFVDGAAALHVTSTVQSCGEEGSSAAAGLDRALHELAESASGSAVVRDALGRFTSARIGSGREIAAHLARVGHVGRSAVLIVAQADDEVARAARRTP